MKLHPFSLPILAFFLATLPACADCDHRAERSAAADLSGVTRVEVLARAGSLDLAVGQAGKLEATGEACASSAALLEKVQLETKRSGDVLRLEVVMPESSGGGWNHQARLDLRVLVPADVPVRIDDSSGDLEARGITLERLDDGSGDIRLDETRGSARIEDGSGNLRVTGHHGDLEIVDGSGDVRLRDIDGRVLIADDGSGNLDIEKVSGNVEVRDDGSGDIDVADVGGDLRIGSAGSGQVRYRDVAGQVDVPRR